MIRSSRSWVEDLAKQGFARVVVDGEVHDLGAKIEMGRYDVAGRRIWRKFMRAQGAPAPESLLSFRHVGRAS